MYFCCTAFLQGVFLLISQFKRKDFFNYIPVLVCLFGACGGAGGAVTSCLKLHDVFHQISFAQCILAWVFWSRSVYFNVLDAKWNISLYSLLFGSVQQSKKSIQAHLHFIVITLEVCTFYWLTVRQLFCLNLARYLSKLDLYLQKVGLKSFKASKIIKLIDSYAVDRDKLANCIDQANFLSVKVEMILAKLWKDLAVGYFKLIDSIYIFIDANTWQEEVQ